MSTTLTGAASGGQPNTFDKPYTTGPFASFSCNWTFTSTDSSAPYVDLRGASRVRVLVDDHAAGAYSFDIESSADGVNSAGKEVTGITSAIPQQLDGPFGFMRPRLPTLASGSLTIYFFVLYD